MPYTTLVAGTNIAASWANTNVRDQVVTPFATAAARASAVTAPVEGMVTYRADDDVIEVYDGTEWLAPAIQVPHTDVSTITPTTARAINPATFADFPDGTALAITKLRDDTKLVVSFQGSAYADATSISVEWGLEIDGTDYGACVFHFTSANVHSGMAQLSEITGVDAGSYDAQLRWRNMSGVNQVKVDTNNRLSFSITETF